MPAKTKKKLVKTKPKSKKTHWRLIVSLFFIFSGVVVLLSQISYFFNWKRDFSAVSWDLNSEPARNLLGKVGVFIGHHTIFSGFGISTLLAALMLIFTGFYLLQKKSIFKILFSWIWTIVYIFLFSWLLAMIMRENPVWGGVSGLEWVKLTGFYLGKWGNWVLWVFLVTLIAVYKFKLEPEHLNKALKSVQKPAEHLKKVKFKIQKDKPENQDEEEENISEKTEKDIIIEAKGSTFHNTSVDEKTNQVPPLSIQKPEEKEKQETNTETVKSDGEFEIKVKEEALVDKPETLVEQFGEFDPTLDLRNYKYPHFDLLKDYTNVELTYDEQELQQNNDKIVKTLLDFGIEIEKIKANVGPSVTLYEIVPKPGIRISKIKNLEDDIAMSLAALGIRIIAPMPGRGTIGIEVPNKNPVLVPLKKVLRSKKFQNAKMELPIALGKTISNETFVFDLTKMPHLLIAGATGQGKSVGLNVIINSLLFKKHPAELKFVMVDPKKVELSLYNTIEKHFLAKLPDEAQAIISDVTKVKQTLNSLVKEMENRYKLLQTAKVRNVIEYNNKFKSRKLNPNNGHRYLPYIVLIIDEFGDFMMTAGKEVEAPIARLAQMARAVGIHIIIATQRPSVNIITGLIKANFPARIAFRVASQVDSRTILDQSGAEKLVGKGDLLITTGNDLVRLQCAFIDTDEVETVTDFIGEQPSYPSAYELPEPDVEESVIDDLDESDRDALFKEAAYIIVGEQQGSASLLQRKLKIGYNRAGRLIDQMEQAGIVGPSRGSKPREVYIKTIVDLDKFFEKN